MRDPNRIDIILKKIEEVWKKNPDLRLGQLLTDAANHSGWKGNDDLFYYEDSDLFKGLELFDIYLSKLKYFFVL